MPVVKIYKKEKTKANLETQEKAVNKKEEELLRKFVRQNIQEAIKIQQEENKAVELLRKYVKKVLMEKKSVEEFTTEYPGVNVAIKIINKIWKQIRTGAAIVAKQEHLVHWYKRWLVHFINSIGQEITQEANLEQNIEQDIEQIKHNLFNNSKSLQEKQEVKLPLEQLQPSNQTNKLDKLKSEFPLDPKIYGDLLPSKEEDPKREPFVNLELPEGNVDSETSPPGSEFSKDEALELIEQIGPLIRDGYTQVLKLEDKEEIHLFHFYLIANILLNIDYQVNQNKNASQDELKQYEQEPNVNQ